MEKWIRNKLRKFLKVEELEEKTATDNTKLRYRNSQLSKEIDQLEAKISNIVSQFNIAADINHVENHSWAVISIAGKPEYVRFINLSNKDMREVNNFLRQFEGSNRIIDSPLPFLKW